MNKQRRKLIDEALDHIQAAYDIIEHVCDGEQEAYDNMPDGLRDSEKGDALQEAVDNLSNAIFDCDTIIEYLIDAKQ